MIAVPSFRLDAGSANATILLAIARHATLADDGRTIAIPASK